MIVDDTLNCLFDDLLAYVLTFFRFGWNRRRTGHASRSQLERNTPLAFRSRSLN